MSKANVLQEAKKWIDSLKDDNDQRFKKIETLTRQNHDEIEKLKKRVDIIIVTPPPEDQITRALA